MRRLVAVLSCLLLAGAGCVALLLGTSGMAAGAQAAAAGTFHPADSVRVLDTRTGAGLAGGHVTRFQVTGRGDIPAGAAAVTINLTVLRPATAGSIAVFPGDTAWNGIASVSFPAGLNKQSMVTAKLGADGTLSVRNNLAGTLQLIGDVAGYYTGGTPSAPGAFRAIPFQRAFDTRTSHPLAPGSITPMPTAGHGGVPATGVAAVLANLTVLTPSLAGSVSTWASDAAWDGSASASFAAGRSEQDVISVVLGSDGTALLRNNTGVALQVVLDLIGYYLAGTPTGYGAYLPITPSRIFDNRPGAQGDPLQSGYPVSVSPVLDKRTGTARLPEAGTPALVLRVSVLTPAHAGSLSIFRGDQAWNGSASISFGAGASVQQQLTTVVGFNNMIQLQHNGPGLATVVIDVLGYYLGVPSPLQYTSSEEIDPAHGRLSDISCPTATFCMAVQSGGFAESWHGSTWSTPARVGQDTELNAVSCTSASFCAAIGNEYDGLVDIETYDGTGWTHAISLPVDTNTKAVSCASASFCLAESRSTYTTFNGNSWSAATTDSRLAELTSLSCRSLTFCMGIDYTGRWTSFNGSGWSKPTWLDDVGNYAVSCASASFCLAVGGTEALTFDGTNWSAPTTIDPNRTLISVSCISSTNCRASDGAGAVLSFNGTDWSAPVPVDSNGPARLSCSAAGTCGLIESSSKATAAIFDGASWGSPQTVDLLPGDLTGVSCTSASFCVAVDAGGYALSYDGASWTPPVQIDGGTGLTGVSCAATSFCVAVDAVGRALTFDGSAWSAAVPVYSGRLAAVSCVSSSFCVTVGADRAATFNGSSWSTPVSIIAGPGLSGVSCRSTTFCMAVASFGSAIRFDGTNWSALQDLTAGGGMRAISCPTTSYCLALGDGGASSWNGSAWSPPFQSAGVQTASCPQAQFCVGVGSSSYHYASTDASVWDGSEWSMPALLTPGGTYYGSAAISCPTIDFCMQLNGRTSAYRLDG